MYYKNLFSLFRKLWVDFCAYTYNKGYILILIFHYPFSIIRLPSIIVYPSRNIC